MRAIGVGPSNTLKYNRKVPMSKTRLWGSSKDKNLVWKLLWNQHNSLKCAFVRQQRQKHSKAACCGVTTFLTSGFKTLLALSRKKHGKTVERASVLNHRRHLGKAILVVQAHCTKLISLCMQLLRFSAEFVSLLPRNAQAILCAMPVSAESYLLKYFP